MNVVPAWKEGITGKGIVVTILDDGLEVDHPDLVENYVSMHYMPSKHSIYYVFRYLGILDKLNQNRIQLSPSL